MRIYNTLYSVYNYTIWLNKCVINQFTFNVNKQVRYFLPSPTNTTLLRKGISFLMWSSTKSGEIFSVLFNRISSTNIIISLIHYMLMISHHLYLWYDQQHKEILPTWIYYGLHSFKYSNWLNTPHPYDQDLRCATIHHHQLLSLSFAPCQGSPWILFYLEHISV